MSGGIHLGKLVVPVQGTPPTSPVAGQLYFDNDAGDLKLYIYDGTNWNPTGVSSAAIGTATASIPFVDGDTMRRVTIPDANVLATSKITGSIRRPDTADDSADSGYIYSANIVKVAAGSFDVLVTATAWGFDDPTLKPPNETVQFVYTIGAATVMGSATRVSALPISPVDGQEIYYVADATNSIVWHLRYNAGSASAYKWEYLGGPPIRVLAGATLSTASAADQTTNAPSYTAPLSGDFNCWWGSDFTQNVGASANDCRLGLFANASFKRELIWNLPSGSGAPGSDKHRITGVVSGQVIDVRYHSNSSLATNWVGVALEIVPLRVG